MKGIYKILILSGLVAVLFVLLNPCEVYYWRDFLELYLSIQRNPNNAWAYYNRATVRRECGDNQGAIVDFTQVIMINSNKSNAPDRADGYYQRGRLRYRLGDIQGAIADLQKAADIYRQKKNTYNYQSTLDEIKQIQQESSPTP